VINNVLTGFTGLGKSLLSFKDIFIEEDNDKKKRKKFGVSVESEAEVIKDQIFKKPESLKKILNKFSTKTYIIKNEESGENYEVDIKITICDAFDYIFDMREDFIIENVVEHFKTAFIEKTYHMKMDEIKKMDVTDSLKTLLPDSYAEVAGTVNTEESKFRNYTQFAEIKSFDAILERPFMESLLMGFFFTQSAPLQNALLGLLKRCCTEKKKLKESIDRLELLFSEEQKTLFAKIQSKIIKLKNLTSNAQVKYTMHFNKLLDLAANYRKDPVSTRLP